MAGKESLDKPVAPASRSWWWWLLPALVIVPWLGQPPLGWWPLGFVANVPYLLVVSEGSFGRRGYWMLFLGAFLYWALTLQGLRLAHPVIYVCWLVLAAYLAVYRVLFVVATKRLVARGVPLAISAPLLWVGMECIRNYMLSGVSAAMLGHTMADVPIMIQIADLGGSYAVSFVLVVVNVAFFETATWFLRRSKGERPFPVSSCALAGVLIVATLGYGAFRLNEPTGEPTTTFALIGRNEPIEYFQDEGRELAIFEAYARQSILAARESPQPVDVVVWPESMFTGTLPWMIGDGNAEQAMEYGLSVEEVRRRLGEFRSSFRARTQLLQQRMTLPDRPAPDLLVGCGVVDYGEKTRVYSGLLHLNDRGAVKHWYAKTHLVMFGEYIPVVEWLPVIRDWIPDDIGLADGDEPRFMPVRQTSVLPNICIETAVERVAMHHLQRLRDTDGLPEVIATVSNDGWFDDSSVVQHHKRCAQLVAVSCRRPILSAANNGPTCWIDSRGVVVEQIPQGGVGNLFARPRIDSREAFTLTLGDWPARLCGLALLATLCWRRRVVSDSSDEDPGDGDPDDNEPVPSA
ncbi:MAG: apolipoprotein N-acyltransferase [Planctomycetota bacterium]